MNKKEKLREEWNKEFFNERIVLSKIEAKELIKEIKEKIKIKIENMTKREIATYFLSEYQRYSISLGATEKYREELSEKQIKTNLKMFENMTKDDILNYLTAFYLLELEI